MPEGHTAKGAGSNPVSPSPKETLGFNDGDVRPQPYRNAGRAPFSGRQPVATPGAQRTWSRSLFVRALRPHSIPLVRSSATLHTPQEMVQEPTGEHGRVDHPRPGVSVPVTTLCPCSKAMSDYGAHNQRGYVKMEVRSRASEDGLPEVVWIEEPIEVGERSASAPVYPLLERPDERYVTMQAHDKGPSSRTSSATSPSDLERTIASSGSRFAPRTRRVFTTTARSPASSGRGRWIARATHR
ncbi:GTP cyclohydrolase FolE2 [Rubrobacter xylanophilus DSM 9941]|nr:GTP cyclohydrolase FolE2 [Rubrobacter xylanophilus DSM 9941]